MASKRKSFGEKLQSFRSSTAGQLEFQQIMEQINKIKADARGYRGFYAISTQQQQNRVLELYREYVKISEKPRLDNATDDELDLECFPDDHDLLCDRAKSFVLLLIAIATPVSRKDKHISYSTAAAYRRLIIYWADYKYRFRTGRNIPCKSTLYSEITEAMRYSAKVNDLQKPSTRHGYIGLAELQYLIDMDTRATPCIDLAECHHLAWCIARITSVRPSSLAPPSGSAHRDDWTNGKRYLAWKDIEILRGNKRGQFIVHITFRILKTNTRDDETEYLRTLDSAGPGPNKTLKFRIASPQCPANLWLSVPHRILVIALRRKVLVDIDTLDELFCGEQVFIRVKQQFMNKPVLLAGGARGLSMSDDDEPLKSNSISNYLGFRGIKAGFPIRPTLYSIRRRVAGDLTAAFGADKAREILGHSAASRTLETYYLEFNYMSNTGAMLAGEDHNDPQQQLELVAATREEYRLRLDKAHIASTQGRALNALVAQLLAEDANYAALMDPKEIRNYQRRARRCAVDTLHEETHIKFRAQLTQSQLKTRDEDVERAFSEASDFAKHIAHVTRQNLRDQQSEPSATNDASVDGVEETHNLDVEFAEPDSDQSLQPLEADAEDMVSEENFGTETTKNAMVDEGGDDVEGDYEATKLIYGDLAYTHMQLLLENAYNERRPGIGGKRLGKRFQCSMCLDDDTISEEDKNKLYQEGHLKRHQESQIHTKNRMFLRRMKEAARENDGEFVCPYCLEAAANNENILLQELFRSQHFNKLVNHIKKSDATRIAGTQAWQKKERAISDHNEAKAVDGWYDDDFEGSQEIITNRLNYERRRQADITWSTDKPLHSGLVIEGRPGLRRGGPLDSSIPTVFEGTMTWDPSEASEITMPLDFAYEGDPEEALWVPIPDNYKFLFHPHMREE